MWFQKRPKFRKAFDLEPVLYILGGPVRQVPDLSTLGGRWPRRSIPIRPSFEVRPFLLLKLVGHFFFQLEQFNYKCIIVLNFTRFITFVEDKVKFETNKQTEMFFKDFTTRGWRGPRVAQSPIAMLMRSSPWSSSSSCFEVAIHLHRSRACVSTVWYKIWGIFEAQIDQKVAQDFFPAKITLMTQNRTNISKIIVSLKSQWMNNLL